MFFAVGTRIGMFRTYGLLIRLWPGPPRDYLHSGKPDAWELCILLNRAPLLLLAAVTEHQPSTGLVENCHRVFASQP